MLTGLELGNNKIGDAWSQKIEKLVQDQPERKKRQQTKKEEKAKKKEQKEPELRHFLSANNMEEHFGILTK